MVIASVVVAQVLARWMLPLQAWKRSQSARKARKAGSQVCLYEEVDCKSGASAVHMRVGQRKDLGVLRTFRGNVTMRQPGAFYDRRGSLQFQLPLKHCSSSTNLHVSCHS